MNTATRQRLHVLVDKVDEAGLETLYNVMIRFIPEDEALLDEIESHAIAVKEYKRGDTFDIDDINWN